MRRMTCLATYLIVAAIAATLSAAEPASGGHPWRPPFGLDRIGYVAEGTDPASLPEFEADAQATTREVVNPVDLGTILVPAGWLALVPGAPGEISVAALSRRRDEPRARLRVWYASAPQEVREAPLPLEQGKPLRLTIPLPPAPAKPERDSLQIVIDGRENARPWQKQIPVMLIHDPPRWPRFGASTVKLRYDAPISVRAEDNTFSSLEYDRGWPAQLNDVVVSLPSGARFVFWRGACYVPFWAGPHNTCLSYEWAETSPPPDGYTDCVEPLMDKELRFGRVEIVESTPARIHVRWSYQSCDFKYKVWGDSAKEDFYFYPDGFGTRVLTLQSELESDYELSVRQPGLRNPLSPAEPIARHCGWTSTGTDALGMGRAHALAGCHAARHGEPAIGVCPLSWVTSSPRFSSTARFCGNYAP